VEDVEIRRNTAQSDREAARSRVVTARQMLERTEVRAPFDGIVSDRKVSAGDTAQVGKELLKVIDPSSLRFEGFVSADSVGEVKTGQHVWFHVHGFNDREFTGVITGDTLPCARISRSRPAFFKRPGAPPAAAPAHHSNPEPRSAAAHLAPSRSVPLHRGHALLPLLRLRKSMPWLCLGVRSAVDLFFPDPDPALHGNFRVRAPSSRVSAASLRRRRPCAAL